MTLQEILDAKPDHSRRVKAVIEEVVTHPNPYNHRPDTSHLTTSELGALIRMFDGYGLRRLLQRRWGEEMELVLRKRAEDRSWVYDPLEHIQEIP